ncbi:DUF4352 domain-containing protein [Ktedonobacter robiniae]|uniref:DUF4352 domain-containing protein n=1 Tax=Ktedonobacter robiniae TaxID=2778365 RepID=A0ABQ3ULH3_9CHLR|nr:DUF4352 domain-containing protein [Ktedonobacter robiniae]GHO53230.1 hypothetical protein KSB_17050 [Ktedonobacter robiniae]
MKKTLVFLAGLFIILGTLLACGGSSDNTGTSTSSSTTSQTSQQVKHFKVGETVKVGDTWEVVVSSAKTSDGDDYTKHDVGNTFLIVNVTVKNISNKEQDISSLLNFKLKDKDGTEGKDAFLTTGVTPAPNGKVAASDQSKGDLTYQVSASQKSFTLAFEADLLSSGQTVWDLSV